ncbi:hypothetical protein EDD17DRAFT_552215 [Pisolithus thermaeus]|nr:hypothetical protein EV401DRAFT_321823 [Pisolithus croceorrhizus]KAI6162531.1 hypothetical protein EDD17DRAFT_552215 [Pisolithus thermaeus]
MQSSPTAVSTPNSYATSSKRARSPGPATERQVKRIALPFANVGDVTSALSVNRRASFVASDVSNPCHFPFSLPSPASGHQGYQEDWVQQAKDLAICEENVNVPSGSASDENMVIDMQPHQHSYSNAPTFLESMSSPVSSSHSHHIATCDHTREHSMSPPPSTAPFSIPAPATMSSSSTEQSPPPSSSTSSVAPTAGQPPAIYFSPATPSSGTPPPSSHDHGLQEQDHDFCVGSNHHQHGTNTVERTSTLRTESIPMGKSCLPPSPCSSGSSRKQRFTMGPRVDCIKCRMGVKGHWVHLD